MLHDEVPVGGGDADPTYDGQVLCTLERIAEQPMQQFQIKGLQLPQQVVYVWMRCASNSGMCLRAHRFLPFLAAHRLMAC